ncbi:ATP-binding protein [Terrabacter sp. C0L_2]|uniref:ATP-binding protein n=1 Tax=Terrabacter sp. C0L_2 TaxID=3108389 RepID=UPI002ED00377|nr:AAA family ATPase [Terrabacter sp. C0L_2]
MEGTPTTTLIGRDDDLGAVTELLDRLVAPDDDMAAEGPGHEGRRPGGGALIFVGEPGIGKTALLQAGFAAAQGRGLHVLHGHGSESERHLPFAVLFDLVHPILDHGRALSPVHRTSLSQAFGLEPSTQPVEPFFVALAALELVVEAATPRPLVLVVDDAHTVDQPSRDVIAFIARRLAAERVALLLATRPDAAIELAASVPDTGIVLRTLRTLDLEQSRRLVHLNERRLPRGVEQAVLRQADGNPLALLELPRALRGAGGLDVDWTHDRAPLTSRLEMSFAARLDDLGPVTRTLLAILSVNDSNLLSEAAAALALSAGRELLHSDITPAVRAGLVTSDGTLVGFRHPLVRSAVWQATPVTERASAHEALARVTAADPDRSVWHRACASLQPDEALAQALEAAALRALTRGAPGTTVQWLERAAELSREDRRAQRLLRAAEVAFELGRPMTVRRLMQQAQVPGLGAAERARLLWLEGAFDDGTPGDADGVRRLIASAASARDRGEPDLAIHLLHGAATRCWWGEPGLDVRSALVDTAASLPLEAGDPRYLATVSVAGDFDRHGEVLTSVARWAERDTVTALQLGSLARAAFVTADFDRVLTFCSPALIELRRQGRLGSLAQVLVFQSFAAMYTGRWDITRVAADEARRLAEETQQPVWLACAILGQANLAALRGESEAAHSVLKEAERIAVLTGNGALLNGVLLSRGFAELGRERPAEAYAHLRRMTDRTDAAFHRTQRAWAVDYLAEAAVGCGETDDARGILASLEEEIGGARSPGVIRAVSYAHALLAPEEEAAARFADAYDLGATASPWYRARLDLARGSWLRRHRQVTASRTHLQSAFYTFEALHAQGWARRAARELRAGGAKEALTAEVPRADLSPQEWQIAQLAAAGLSNRDIGQQLYLSHRTVASHLYRIFPKLGITSRTQLHAYLQERQEL